MSLLSGPEIERIYSARAYHDGKPVLPYIDIDPWPVQGAGPNSIDLRLAPQLLAYRLDNRTDWINTEAGGIRLCSILDCRLPNPTFPLTIPESGFILLPGTLYIGSTIERTETHGLVPVINGRSSIGRLGISVHVTAGFGDDGFGGANGENRGATWTLEITCVHPVRIYSGLRICQIAYHTLEGERRPYSGRYNQQSGPVASRMYEPDGATS